MSREYCPEDMTYQDIVIAIKMLKCYIERVEEVKRLLRRVGIGELFDSRSLGSEDFMKDLARYIIKSSLQQQRAEGEELKGFTEEEKQRLRELAKKYIEQKA